MTDDRYMKRAIELAKTGEGWCHPNPLVGAVIVKNNKIIAEGYHAKFGDLHAERSAIAKLRESAEGATVYVTLEPCAHQGKQPPCALAIVEAGIKKAVIGSRDPNPLVSGKGISFLRENNIEVVEDFMKKDCDELNRVFFHYITTGMPYVNLKYAMTLDGKIATKTGESKWISSENSRKKVHELRHASMGIMTGIGTVIEDDPLLNCRLDNGRSPLRIICDSGLKTPLNSRIVKTAESFETIIASAVKGLKNGEITREIINSVWESGTGSADENILKKISELLDRRVRIFNFPSKENKTDLKALIRELGNRGLDSVLIEGGGTLNEAALRENLVDEINIFIAPKIFGGNSKTPVMGFGVSKVEEAYKFKLHSLEQIDDDIRLTYLKSKP